MKRIVFVILFLVFVANSGKGQTQTAFSFDGIKITQAQHAIISKAVKLNLPQANEFSYSFLFGKQAI